MKLQRTMTTTRPRALGAVTLVACAALTLFAGCGSAPRNNDQLNAARGAYTSAAADPQVRDGAPAELKQAADALARADEALNRREEMATVDHLAYVASQRVDLARAAGSRKASEAAVAQASADRDRQRLEARTQEADAATRSAQASQMQAQSAERDARISQRQADASRRDSVASQQQADAATMQAGMAQQEAQAAQQRTRMLEDQLRDLNAKQTPRGMVITIGDVLFDTGRAEMKTGGMRDMDKLAGFLQAYPQRKLLVEGFTDSVGSDSMNQDLSARRADAVRAALVSRGIEASRIGTQGYGESFPVAGNDNASGRQMNRRVEVVLSDDRGVVAPR